MECAANSKQSSQFAPLQKLARSSPGVSCTLPGGTADHRFRGTARSQDTCLRNWPVAMCSFPPVAAPAAAPFTELSPVAGAKRNQEEPRMNTSVQLKLLILDRQIVHAEADTMDIVSDLLEADSGIHCWTHRSSNLSGTM